MEESVKIYESDLKKLADYINQLLSENKRNKYLVKFIKANNYDELHKKIHEAEPLEFLHFDELFINWEEKPKMAIVLYRKI